MGYRERIEDAVIAMFEGDRQLEAAIERECPNLAEHIDYMGSGHIAMDLLGVPQDNTVETNACDRANVAGVWPKDAYCRDCFVDMWLRDAKDGREFVDYCYDAIREYAEKTD